MKESRFDFKWANGSGYGYGKNYREAARNLVTRNSEIHCGIIIQVASIENQKWGKAKKIGYWDCREFLKEVSKGLKLKQIEYSEQKTKKGKR